MPMLQRISTWAAAFLILFCLAAGVAEAQARLPQKHDYQRVLRAHMATLTEQDFAHGVTDRLSVQPSSQDPDYLYRNYLLSATIQPLVGTKRGYPSVNAPARIFTLGVIEGVEKVIRPPVWPEPLMTFVQWNYPGNPYHGNRGLKLRAFAWCSLNLMMLDDYIEEQKPAPRGERFAYQLITMGSPYAGFADLLPPDVQDAYRFGIRKLAQRIIDWGIRGEEPFYDLITPVGLWYASQVVGDPGFTQQVEAHARVFFTDPKYFHPAGYFVDHGGCELARGGTTNYFAVWAAVATDWPFAKEAVDRIYRLRAHLLLPEPDGSITGPCQFNALRGAPVSADNWIWDGVREHAAAMISDEAVCQAPLPSAELLAGAAARRAQTFQGQLMENPVQSAGPNGYVYVKNEDIQGHPWEYRLWATYNFPASVNPGYEFYRPGAYARRVALEQQNPALTKLPFERPGTFVHNFADAFVATKQAGYGAVLHTGPVGHQSPDDGRKPLPEPLGFGGGELSAFWTPATGAVLQGRRRSLTDKETFDKIEEWRLWPIHAVSGQTTAGKVFTSARIAVPQVTPRLTDAGGAVEVAGTIPAEQLGLGQVLPGKLDYQRTFEINQDRLRVSTTLTTAIDQIGEFVSELYETLPVFHREKGEAPVTVIEFQAGNEWRPAAAEPMEAVTAIRLTRFNGAVQITFEQPQRVQLSPAEWQDTFMTRAVCRNILIDRRDITRPTLTYTIAPVVKP